MFETIYVCHSCYKVRKKDVWLAVSFEQMRDIHDIAQLYDERLPVEFIYCPECKEEI